MQYDPFANPGDAASAAPDFIPVDVSYRKDGWTPEKQRRFIEILADTGSVDDAAILVGMSRESAYRLRRRTDAGDFAKAWEAALEMSTRRLIDIAFDRAVNGVVTPVFHKGDQIGVRRQYSDRLLMSLLRAYAPHRFAPDPRLPQPDPRRRAFRGLPLMLNKLLRRGRAYESRIPS